MFVFVQRLTALIVPLVLIAAFGATAEQRPLEAKIQTAFKKGELSGLHSVLVIHGSEILAERHFAGIDQPGGGSWSKRKHGPETLHDLRSITKSIVGLLYGIALAEGKVPGIDQSLLEQFPEYADLVSDPLRKNIRVEDALTMRMGTAWNQELSYRDYNNTERQLEYAKDPVRFALDRPMVRAPGKSLEYNSGAVAALARLIERGSGMPIEEYAALKLFDPLGIDAFEWPRRADGETIAYTGLRLNIHDLAKIGKLILQRGRFRGRQIIPAEWIAVSLKPRAVNKRGMKYGYFWWLFPEAWRGLPAMVAGLGDGGQTLAVQLKHKLIVVIFAGNYDESNHGKLPLKIMTKFVMPALQTKLKR